MATIDQHILEIAISADRKRQFEDAAKALNLSPSAYFAYLLDRVSPGVDAPRLDRHVREVFGKHGELMRRLAK